MNLTPETLKTIAYILGTTNYALIIAACFWNIVGIFARPLIVFIVPTLKSVDAPGTFWWKKIAAFVLSCIAMRLLNELIPAEKIQDGWYIALAIAFGFAPELAVHFITKNSEWGKKLLSPKK